MSSVKIYLFLLAATAIFITGSCKKRIVDLRNKYWGDWKFTVSIKYWADNSTTPVETGTFTKGKIFYNRKDLDRNSIIIDFGIDGEKHFDLIRGGILSGCGIENGEFSDRNNISFTFNTLYCDHVSGSYNVYTVTGTKVD